MGGGGDEAAYLVMGGHGDGIGWGGGRRSSRLHDGRFKLVLLLS